VYTTVIFGSTPVLHGQHNAGCMLASCCIGHFELELEVACHVARSQEIRQVKVIPYYCKVTS